LISLILPYWERQEAANKALESLKQYSQLDLQIIVVDDGSEVPFVIPEGMQIDVVRLPEKKGPKCPVTPWNEGAKHAKGDVLVLSCVEIIHDTPILEALTKDIGDDDYVVAAAWCPEDNRWHAHSTVDVPDCPKGSSIAFCAALKPELYWRAGGFDESYREGAGYEDRDWIMRLHAAGARFVLRDDLVVTHPKSNATIHWGQEKFDRNLKIYRDKWPLKEVTFVCLNQGNYGGKGAEYVNVLADMVKRNMPPFCRWRFMCLTDDASGLDDGIEVIPLPADLIGWWGKLYLFKRGLFTEGDRIIYLDLDTLVVGALDKILSYQGDMAILRDFYQPRRGAPGVILWRSGFGHFIWDEWIAQGRPENELGDLGWIEGLDQGRFTKQLDRLQDLYPDFFVSYKVHCQPFPPVNASVVCFHGQPKPHNCFQQWVANVWKIGGAATLNFKVAPNTPNLQTLNNVIANENAAPWLKCRSNITKSPFFAAARRV
jgi:glycosyltransferase involved in cell wall biosynthesis